MRHMDETLRGRQHNSMSHRLSYRRPASWWEHNGPVFWQVLGYGTVMAVLLFILGVFGDLP